MPRADRVAPLLKAEERAAVSELMILGASIEESAEILGCSKERIRRLRQANLAALQALSAAQAAKAREVMLSRLEELYASARSAATASEHVHSYGKEDQPRLVEGPSVPHAMLAKSLLEAQADLLGLNAPTKTESKSIVGKIDLSMITEERLQARAEHLRIAVGAQKTIDAPKRK